MKYFIPATILIVYFEFLGQYISRKISLDKVKIGFGLGFIVFLAYTYIFSSFITSNNLHFAWIFFIYSAFFVVSIVLMIKDRKIIKYEFNLLHLLIVVLVILFLYFSFNTSLGHIYGFDTTHYLNMVTGNANWDYLNTKSVLYGSSDSLSKVYSYQTYYYFASYIVYIFATLFDFLASTTYIWTFQTLFYFLYFTLIVNTFEVISKKRISTLIIGILFLGFYFGKLYFNSVFGFYGNNYRFIIFGYISLFIYLYFKENTLKNKLLVSIAIFSACSVSSSSLFMVVIEMFAIFLINVNKDNKLITWMALTLFMPLINLGHILLGNLYLTLIVVIPILSIVIYFNNFIHLITKKYKLNLVIAVLSIIFMIVMSFRITGNLLDFNVFFSENLSERADMTINYLNIDSSNIIRFLYVIIYVVTFIVVLVNNRRDGICLIISLVFLIFLNPISCNYFYKVNIVYHRTFDIIFNSFIFMYLIDTCFEIINSKKIETAISVILALLFIFKGDLVAIQYYTNEFIPDENYNKLYKMDNDKLDVIFKLKEDIDSCGMKKPKIVTDDLLTQSIITDGIYTYGRWYNINDNWSKSEYQVYSIFLKEKGFDGILQPKDVDIDNMEKYIKDAKIDYLVLDKEQSYKDSKTGEYKPLMYKVDEFKYPFYENENYVIYHFENR